MYVVYGWPQVIPLESVFCPASEQIIHLKVINRLLLVVAPSHSELWSSSKHKVRLGKSNRDSDLIQREGENLRAVWSLDSKLIAVLFFYLFPHDMRLWKAYGITLQYTLFHSHPAFAEYHDLLELKPWKRNFHKVQVKWGRLDFSTSGPV